MASVDFAAESPDDGALPARPVAPMFLWDLYRRRQVHRAYLIYALINAPFVILTILLWNDPWWQKTVPALMGFA